MATLSKLRKNKATQLDWSLKTGTSIEALLQRSNGIAANKKIINFLCETDYERNPIIMLDEDNLLDAKLSILRNASFELSQLEESLGLNRLEIKRKLFKRWGTSTLEYIFPQLSPNNLWSGIEKQDFIKFLNEFDWWCRRLAEFDLENLDLGSANEIYNYLSSSAIKQLPDLQALIGIKPEGWALDATVFENILDGINQNPGKYIQSWLSSEHPGEHYNAKSNRQYNSFYSWMWLSLVTQLREYESNKWATKRQWRDMGYELKEGEESSPAPVIHFFNTKKPDAFNIDIFNGTDKNNTGSLRSKVSLVYNAEQVENYKGDQFILPNKVFENEEVDTCVEYHEIDIYHYGDSAYFDVCEDAIYMPEKDRFRSRQATLDYYETLLHESVHWTGHETRLNREFNNKFGDKGYAFEELIAEMGAVFLCSRFGLSRKPRQNQIAYITNWLNSTEGNSVKVLQHAGLQAHQACNYFYQPLNKSRVEELAE
ncbi:TPA: zincin-like metallopeptidase domain-containing protein [Photobacterium damselae]